VVISGLLLFGPIESHQAVKASNSYVQIDQIYKPSDGETTYVYVKWTLLQKWNTAAVAVYPSLNGNLPSISLSSCFVGIGVGNICYDQFQSLGLSLDT